jgi:anhydro-N-acetylmuramic acid kinase
MEAGTQAGWVRAVGVISGTSMDAIDVAVIDTDGGTGVRPVAVHAGSYPDAVRAALRDLLKDPDRARAEPLDDLERAVTDAHVAAIRDLLRTIPAGGPPVTLVGFHGQTVLHRPKPGRPNEGFTRQLGSGAEVAARLGIETVDRFRHADVAAGGEGAPFAPLYHRALAASLPQPLMVLNLGGVGNVTYLDGETVIAFDTGPANGPLDDFVKRRLGLDYDADGRVAGAGTADAGIVTAFLADPYFARPAPKSLDRQDFARHAAAAEILGDADGAATLTAFAVESAAAALDHVPARPARWLVTGGGRRNGYLMNRLAVRLGVPVEPVEAVGWNGDFLEAQAFAYLAVRSRRGLPLSLPTTTGVPTPTTGGEFHRAA